MLKNDKTDSPMTKEAARVAALQEYHLLDTLPEQSFDDMSQLAAFICEVPIALISLIDTDRQWFKAKVGLEQGETPRDISFCTHAIQQREVFVVPDALQDPRFANNPLVTSGPYIRFYAGAPLVTTQGFAVGTLCVIDNKPRTLRPEQAQALQALSRQVMAQCELRREIAQRREAAALLHLQREAMDASSNGIVIADMRLPDHPLIYVNPAFETISGYKPEDILGKNCRFLQGADRESETNREARQTMRDALKRGVPCNIILHNFRKDGKTFWNELFMAPIFDAAGVLTHCVGVQNDVTARVEAETALQEAHDELEQRVAERTASLRQQEQFLRNVLDTDPNLIFVKNAEGVYTLANQSLASLYGVTPEDVVGKTDADFNKNSEETAQFMEDDRDVIRCQREKFIPTEVLTDCEGRTHWLQTVKRPLASPDGTVQHLLGICTDITARKKAEDQIAHQAFHDPLTDLPNRALLLNRLEQALARSARTMNAIGLLFVDLDNFKVINDSLGHDAGDRLLQTIAERLNGCTRPGDTVARLGGDEFVILLEELCDAAEAEAVAQRATEAIHQSFRLGERDVFPGASIGLTLTALGDARTAGDLLRDADTAMYQAKLQGKGRYTLFDASMNTKAQERLELEADMREAIQSEEFVVHYQPLVDFQSGEMSGVEALVRWEHPTRGLISPAKFIPLAEETGLIVPLGRWVLRQACLEARRWQTTYPDAHDLVMSVNLSIRQMMEKDLITQVAAILEESGLAAEHLKLEITESMMLHDTGASIQTMTALQELGIRLAIDDFGTGYSSMSHLSQLPLNTLKIDRSFVNRIGVSDNDEAVIRAIIILARTLRLSVTCEGIETQEQFTYLQDLGCDTAQGYLMHKPLPVAQIEALLKGEKGERNPLTAEMAVDAALLPQAARSQKYST